MAQNKHDAEVGVVVDLFLSYRAVKGWGDMIALGQKMSAPLAATVLVQEQLGLALNRANRGEEAERILLALIASHGPSSETFGLLGRVYLDRWEAALKAGEKVLAKDQQRAESALADALVAVRESWEPETTARNLRLIREVREKRQDAVAWAMELENDLSLHGKT